MDRTSPSLQAVSGAESDASEIRKDVFQEEGGECDGGGDPDQHTPQVIEVAMIENEAELYDTNERDTDDLCDGQSIMPQKRMATSPPENAALVDVKKTKYENDSEDVIISSTNLRTILNGKYLTI